jgi:Uma2 family endonuclease
MLYHREMYDITQFGGDPPMATTTERGTILEPSLIQGRIVIHGVDWGDYEKMLEIVGDRHIRVTYDEGTMEVSMPSQRHEQASGLLGLLIPWLAEELEIDYEPLGMTTWRRPDLEKGLEADQCYYIQHEAIVRQRVELNLEVDPPPDLAVEVDITSSSLNRMEIYAALRVPELWRYDDDERLTMYQLQADRRYRPCETSSSFPGLRGSDGERLIELGRTMPKRLWAREIRAWVRNELIPRRQAGQPPEGGGPAPA